jgi:hypothetical protein
MIGKPTSGRDKQMMEAGEASSVAGATSGKTTHMSFMAASRQ